MSTSSNPTIDQTIEQCQPEDITPVRLEAETVESTSPSYLRELKSELQENGLFPAGLTIEVSFDEDCSLITQREADRIREYVRAGSFLGVGSVHVSVDDVANPEKVRPALDACFERARRDGIALEIDSSVPLER
ncbi:hypothetical protein [Halostagnicola sp. A-GB9-2]|uniref:hypothetical protein n=1 Tax=Halostagnicola sp. A-GB9-2 TaxID=3048066 RepID=UPI0024BF2CA4|nr:hypothetical protein [Halostagnicola sp. A-GB9-2]MDJ1433358.1 hypothetical protein [Halostagnicola sp. A-GB9-2]